MKTVITLLHHHRPGLIIFIQLFQERITFL